VDECLPDATYRLAQGFPWQSLPYHFKFDCKLGSQQGSRATRASISPTWFLYICKSRQVVTDWRTRDSQALQNFYKGVRFRCREAGPRSDPFTQNPPPENWILTSSSAIKPKRSITICHQIDTKHHQPLSRACRATSLQTLRLSHGNGYVSTSKC
jgi:hypothetical protein